MNYNITKEQAYNFLVALSELQDNTPDDYFHFTHLLSELISGENDNNWILETHLFTYLYLYLVFRDNQGFEYNFSIRFEIDYGHSYFTIFYDDVVDPSNNFTKRFTLFSSTRDNSKTFFMSKPEGFTVSHSISELLDLNYVLSVTGNLTFFNFKKITDNNKLFKLRTSYIDVDNNIIINEPNKASSFGLGYNSYLTLLKNTDKIARYCDTINHVFLNDIDCSYDGLIPSSSESNSVQNCLVPQFFKTVHYGLQTNVVYYCSDDLEFLDTDYEDYNSPLSVCYVPFEIDCEDCAQINYVFRSIFNAFQMINNAVESDNDDMPDYTQILTNINTNLANIHSDLHATVLDEQDNPVDMNVPQALVEVNNSIQADSDKPVIVGNEDLSPWSAV